jgi:hypothetical protein
MSTYDTHNTNDEDLEHVAPTYSYYRPNLHGKNGVRVKDIVVLGQMRCREEWAEDAFYALLGDRRP